MAEKKEGEKGKGVKKIFKGWVEKLDKKIQKKAQAPRCCCEGGDGKGTSCCS